MQMKPITELPALDEGARAGNRGFSRSFNNGSGRGGSFNGNRNSERSSKNSRAFFMFINFIYFIFRCLLQMYVSLKKIIFEIGKKSFILGQKEGHKSFECPEGGRRSGGRDQSSNGSGCFNCGKDGHKSFECPEAKRGRPSSGGRGGARGGGFKRTFAGNQENSFHSNETPRKKIKFNDDDE